MPKPKTVSDHSSRVCVVGAGSSGLAAARNFREVGLGVDVLEACTDLGGNWNYELSVSRVYRSTHAISSKAGTEFPDYPMPEAFPDYPHHKEMLAYLRGYAKHFSLTDCIEFDRKIDKIEPSELRDPSGGHGWTVHLKNGEIRSYGAIAIANGHNNQPVVPDYPGYFTGESMHSADYKVSETLIDKRVLVVGGGNSGCDIVVEAAHKATAIFHSTRRSYHYIPKYLWGKPSDTVAEFMHQLRIPVVIQRWIANLSLFLDQGRQEDFGLPKPDHRLFETHPIVNSLLQYFVRHGAITPKVDIEKLEERKVYFVDGSSEEIDLLVWATGYKTTFPFMEEKYLNWFEGMPRLYKHIFHPEYDNLFVLGMVQPDSGQFGIVHWQCRAAALYLNGVWGKDPSCKWLKRNKCDPVEDLSGGIRFQKTYRHQLEVEHASYTRQLKRLVRQLKKNTGNDSQLIQ